MLFTGCEPRSGRTAFGRRSRGAAPDRGPKRSAGPIYCEPAGRALPFLLSLPTRGGGSAAWVYKECEALVQPFLSRAEGPRLYRRPQGEIGLSSTSVLDNGFYINQFSPCPFFPADSGGENTILCSLQNEAGNKDKGAKNQRGRDAEQRQLSPGCGSHTVSNLSTSVKRLCASRSRPAGPALRRPGISKRPMCVGSEANRPGRPTNISTRIFDGSPAEYFRSSIDPSACRCATIPSGEVG